MLVRVDNVEKALKKEAELVLQRGHVPVVLVDLTTLSKRAVGMAVGAECFMISANPEKGLSAYFNAIVEKLQMKSGGVHYFVDSGAGMQIALGMRTPLGALHSEHMHRDGYLVVRACAELAMG